MKAAESIDEHILKALEAQENVNKALFDAVKSLSDAVEVLQNQINDLKAKENK